MKGRDFMKKIITISRECGSGGHTIGEKLSKELGIPLYDREIIELTAKESGMTREFVEESNDRITNSILFNIANSMTYANQIFSGGSVSLVDKVYFIQCEIIKKIAQEGPCIIVGRCADYVLKDRVDVVNVFIHASKDFRVKRFEQTNKCTPKEAEVAVKKRDKGRKNFYRYYSDREWGDIDNYTIALDSEKTGIDRCVHLIKEIYEEK